MGKKFKYLFLSLAFLFAFSTLPASAQVPDSQVNNSEEQAAPKEEGKLNISNVIFGHVKDAYEWHLFSIAGFTATVHFPVLIYNPTHGFVAFSSAHFGDEDAPQSYEGYSLVDGNTIVSQDGSPFYDFSLTKNVVALFGAVILILWLFLSVAKRYKQRGSDAAPHGLQNAVEVCIQFIRNDVAKPALGHRADRFMPLLLTIFFFIWIVNILGMLPGGANVTGNIAITAGLALVSFMVMLFSSKAKYWGHLFNPPGMPFFVKVILVPIEIISLIIKPTALMIRLFANILAGHIVLICFVLLIFIFAEMNVYVGSGFSIISVALSVFSILIELLVTAIQAYIFAFLTAIFVSQMYGEEEGHGSEGHGVVEAA